MSRTLHWRRIHFDDAKAKIKAELDRIEQESGPAARLRFILDRINQLANSTDSLDLVDRFVLTVSALMHHFRCGGLSRQQIRDLTQMSKSILRLRKINPGESGLSFLHGEVHNSLSLIDHQDGDFLSSAWQLMMAHDLSKPSSIGGEAYEVFSVATRLARLGAGELAAQYAQHAMELGLPPRETAIAYALRVKLARLAMNYGLAQDLAAKASERIEPTEAAYHEIQYQLALIEACRTLDLYPVIRLVKKKSPQYTTSNLLDLRLWSLAMPSDRWMEQTAVAAQIRKRKGVSFVGIESMARSVERLDESYDTAIPLAFRMQRLEDVLHWSKSVTGIDKELLVLAALARFLLRNHRQNFADLVIHRYETLSMSLTSGRSRDALGILQSPMM